jgi:hypothetical protein
MEVGRLEQLGHPLTLEQQDRLAAGYGPLVERFYSSDVWLPGLREYVDKHLSHSEQCEVLAYCQTDVGRKVFEMQVTPGELEFVRQQATINPVSLYLKFTLPRSGSSDVESSSSRATAIAEWRGGVCERCA